MVDIGDILTANMPLEKATLFLGWTASHWIGTKWRRITPQEHHLMARDDDPSHQFSEYQHCVGYIEASLKHAISFWLSEAFRPDVDPAEKRRKAFHIISHAGLYDALHALQDSYSPAHTDRSETTFSIMEVRAWDVTNMDVCGLLGLSTDRSGHEALDDAWRPDWSSPPKAPLYIDGFRTPAVRPKPPHSDAFYRSLANKAIEASRELLEFFFAVSVDFERVSGGLTGPGYKKKQGDLLRGFSDFLGGISTPISPRLRKNVT